MTVMTGLRDGTFGGMNMSGRWDIFAMMAVCLIVLNIGGEELWWRGIILPRQELAFGKWAWLVNGLLWDLFHFFYHSNAASVVSYMAGDLADRLRGPADAEHVAGDHCAPGRKQRSAHDAIQGHHCITANGKVPIAHCPLPISKVLRGRLGAQIHASRSL